MKSAVKQLIRGATAGALIGMVLFALWCMFDTFSDYDASPYIYNKVGPDTFMMLNPDNLNSGGTGFSVRAASGSVYTLTNAHVCSISKTNYLVARHNGRDVRLTIMDIWDKADLCLVAGLPGHRGLDLADRAYQGEHVYLTGHPWLNPLTITNGYLGDKEFIQVSYCSIMNMLNNFGFLDEIIGSDCIKTRFAQVASLESHPGNSGSSVTNSSGELVGVLFAGNEAKVSIMVPLEDIKDYLSAF